jgi:hypothetical protein
LVVARSRTRARELPSNSLAITVLGIFVLFIRVLLVLIILAHSDVSKDASASV